MSDVKKTEEAKVVKSASKAEKKASAKKPVAKKEKVTALPRFYDLVSAPIITEKSQMASEYNKIVFRVAPDASKTEVKEAVASIFGVEVLKVNIVNLHGKEKRFRGIKGRRNDTKKAIVTLAEGQNIDIASGVK